VQICYQYLEGSAVFQIDRVIYSIGYPALAHASNGRGLLDRRMGGRSENETRGIKLLFA